MTTNPPSASQQQLARAARYYSRILDSTAPMPTSAEEFNALEQRMVAYEDNAWSFFIHCWHVRDWIKYDPTIDPAIRTSILKAAETSRALQICADVANGRKHLKLDRPPRVGAEFESLRASWTSLGGTWTIGLYMQIGGDQKDVIDVPSLAWDALRSWEQILQAHGVPLPEAFPDLSIAPRPPPRLCT